MSNALNLIRANSAPIGRMLYPLAIAFVDFVLIFFEREPRPQDVGVRNKENSLLP